MGVYVWSDGRREYECDGDDGDCRASVWFYPIGHELHGMYECMDCDADYECGHEDQHAENIEYDDAGAPFGTHRTYTVLTNVCDYCEMALEPVTDDDFDYSDELREAQYA